MKWAGLVVAVVACRGGTENRADTWQRRTGPGFEVTAPYAAKVGKQPIAPGVDGDTFEYGAGDLSLQIRRTPLSQDRIALEAIQDLRDGIAERDKIVHEEDVDVGDVLGKDITYRGSRPIIGEVVVRERILVQDHVAYTVIAFRPVTATDAGADRFVESFRFTTPSKAPPPHFVSGPPDADGWATARSPNGFSLRAPGKIEERQQEEDGMRTFTLTTMKLPERIELTASCVVASTEQSQADFLADHPEIETRTDRVIAGRNAIEYDDENARFAVIFDGTRTCILIVSPYSVSAPRPVELAKKFFDSFAFES